MTTSIRVRALFAAFGVIPSVLLASQQPRDAASAVRTGTSEVAGTLVTDDTTSSPVRRASVTLTGADLGTTHLVAVTDDAGGFAFTSLPTGRYSLSASKGGYVPSAFGAKRPGGPGTTIVVGDGQHVVGLVMKLLKGSVLTGTVLDENGRPAPDVTVSALQYAVSFQTGGRTLQPAPFASSHTTDDRGMYRIYGLAPGEYVVSATSSMRPNGDPRAAADIHQTTEADIQRAQQLLRESGGTPSVPAAVPGGSPRTPGSTVIYAPVYYPAAVAAADATMISLGPHEERSGIDVHLRMVPTARIEGVVSGPDGAPIPDVRIMMMDPGPLPQDVILMVFRSATSDRQGRFVLPGIPPGRYTISATEFPGAAARAGGAGGPTGPALSAETEVSVEGDDVTTSLVLSPGVAVSGRMVFEGALAPPDPATVPLILVRSPLTVPGFGGLRANADGTFTFPSVMPGSYRIAVNGRGRALGGWLLKSVKANSDDWADVALDIRPNENVDGVVVTFTDQRTEISGRMQDAAGKPAPEYFIIVFSADKRFWVPQSRRTQEVRPGADGQFIVRDLPAGDYLMSALTDVEPDQWNDPAFLAALAAHGPITITLGEGEKKVQDIRVGGG
jgi:uncharacterized protein (DUF2141 family)